MPKPLMPLLTALIRLALTLTVICGATSIPARPEKPDPQPKARAAWTILLFSMADCDLEEPMLEDLRQMAAVGSSQDVNLVVLCDRSADHSEEPLLNLPDFTSAKYLLAQRGSFRELRDLGEPNLGEPSHLAEFIRWGVTQFPARRTALILSDHGGAWPAFGGDDSVEDDGALDLAELKAAVSQGLNRAGLAKLDLIGFDACLMQTLEVAAAFRPFADYFIASEETEPGHGWDYRSFRILREAPSSTPVELGRSLIDGFLAEAQANDSDNEVTLSLLDLGRLSRVEAALKGLYSRAAQAIQAEGPKIGRARARANAYGKNPNPAGCVNTIDLGHFAALLQQNDPGYATITGQIRTALAEAVLYMRNGPGQANSSGLAVYIPDKTKYYDAEYDRVPEAEAWRSFLKTYYGAGAALPQEEQAVLTNSDNLAEVGVDEDGDVVISGQIDTEALENIVEATLEFGVVDGDDIFIVGDMTGLVDEDGVASAFFPLEILTIRSGGKETYGYISYILDGDEIEINMPFHYYPPGEEDYLEAFALITGNVDQPEEEWEQMYYVEEDEGTYGELELEEGSRVVPILLKLAAADSEIEEDEWVETEPVVFDADDDLEIDFEKLADDETIYLQLSVEDYGGNSDYVYYQGPIPGKESPAGPRKLKGRMVDLLFGPKWGITYTVPH